MTGVLMNQQQKMGADVGFFGQSHKRTHTHRGEFQCSRTQPHPKWRLNQFSPLFPPLIFNHLGFFALRMQWKIGLRP